MLKLKLPQFSCGAQSRAFINILRFFTAMLVLTLIARGASNVIMPTVTIVAPVAANIVQKIEKSGEVIAFSAVPVFIPSELLLENVLVCDGEQVKKGDALATFSQKETQSTQESLKANIAKLKAEKAQLLQKTDLDSSAVSAAQTALDRAYAAHTLASENYNVLCAEPSEDTAALNAARQAVENALVAAQDAEAMRNVAIESYKNQEIQSTLVGNTNAAAANLLAIEIKALQEKVTAIDNIIKNAYTLLSPENGIVAELLLQNGKLSQSVACQINKSDEGLGFQFVLDAKAAQQIAVGAAIEITQNTLSEKTQVSAVAIKSDSEVLITARLKQNFKLGAASAVLELSRTMHDLCLPPQAVSADNNGSFVYIIEPKNTILGIKNVCVRVAVTALERGEHYVAVSGAIGYNSQIIAAASRPTFAGSTVRVEQ